MMPCFRKIVGLADILLIVFKVLLQHVVTILKECVQDLVFVLVDPALSIMDLDKGLLFVGDPKITIVGCSFVKMHLLNEFYHPFIATSNALIEKPRGDVTRVFLAKRVDVNGIVRDGVVTCGCVVRGVVGVDLSGVMNGDIDRLVGANLLVFQRLSDLFYKVCAHAITIFFDMSPFTLVAAKAFTTSTARYVLVDLTFI